MSTTLTITSDAAFPDRGTQGLHVAFATGNDGAYLSHDLGDDAPLLHVRLLLAPHTATGGAVRVAGGHDDSGAETWWLDFDTDARLVRLTLATGDELTATLNALPWHCLEVAVDTLDGTARLWVNGIEHSTAEGTFSALVTRSVWLGGMFKDTALAGDLYLDEWAIDTQYVGPAVATPTSAYADDPRRWLVLYNAAVPDAVTWTEAYRQARGVPFANLLGLTLPTSETITGEQYASLASAVNDYLATTGLQQQIMGVLVGFGVPGYVQDGSFPADAVPALMHSAHLDTTLTHNPLAADALPTRPTFDDLAGQRMTARIDGPTLTDALALIDRADDHLAHGLGEGDAAMLWLDPFAGSPTSEHGWWRQQMVDWALSLDRQRLRLPFEISGDPHDAEQPEVNFTAIRNDAFFWGWPAPTAPAPPAGFFDEPAGRRACCVQLHADDPTATTLRSATPTNWVDSALAAGYAAAVGTSRQCSLSNTPYVRPFFEALRHGWTLGEAWFLALPIQREGQHLVGDPLLRTRFPARGWDVFGPVRQLEQVDPAAPAALLRADIATFNVQDEARLPDDGDEAVYLVRRVDEHGRSEAGLTLTRVVRDGDTLRQPAVPPAWPDRDGWRPRLDLGQVHPALWWERPARQARVQAVSLLAEVDDEPEAVAFTADVTHLDPHAYRVITTLPLPAQPARYRWRLVADDGSVTHTPYSAIVRPTPLAAQPLNLLEVRP
ncbi:MAG: TIGR03790 family protein [Phycisphaeraceae bacterium]